MNRMPSLDDLWNVTSLVGVACLSYSAFAVSKFLWVFLQPSRLQQYNHDEAWALVTGASDGIGLGFAQELLSRKFHVLLHGRNGTKLQRIQGELKKEFPGRSVEYVIADASVYDDSYTAVVEKVKKLPGRLTILINNVGGQHVSPTYAPHAEASHEAIDNTINTNLRFITHLVKELIPVLQENGPSLLATVGSVGGVLGVPYLVTYCGTKGYIHSFTEALKNELLLDKVDKIDVVCYRVGNVTSNSNTGKVPFTTTSRECAASCLDKAGANTEAIVWAHFKHWIQTAPVAVLPKTMARSIMGESMKPRLAQAREEHARKTG